jgi:hypothetical protein
VIGRGFQPGDNEPGREREVVLSHALWRRRYGADRGIVGKTIRLDDQDYLVTGVAAPKFAFPQAADLWTPMAMTPAQRNGRRGSAFLAAGRLKPGRTIAISMSWMAARRACPWYAIPTATGASRPGTLTALLSARVQPAVCDDLFYAMMSSC